MTEFLGHSLRTSNKATFLLLAVFYIYDFLSQLAKFVCNYLKDRLQQEYILSYANFPMQIS